jgi:hypothetical protein
MPEGDTAWQPIETAPKDGSTFLCLIDGLPYAARFDEHGRFIWYWHSDDALGPSYIVHRNVSEGKTLLEETKPRDPPNYVCRGHLWVKGFDEQKRTHWMPLPPSPETP